MDSCEDCKMHIANVYGPLEVKGAKWYIKRKTPSGKLESIMFFGLPNVFRIKVCPNCGSRKLTRFDHATFPNYEQLEAGLIQSKDFLESQGFKLFVANYSEPEEKG